MTTYYLQQTNVDWDGDNTAEAIEYEFQLIQNLTDLKEKGFTVAGAPEAEKSVAYGFTPPKVRVPIEWVMYDNGEDKSRGTLISSGINDARLQLGDNGIVGVDTTNDIVTVTGDQTSRVADSDQIAIRGSSGNSGIYNVSSTSYDSSNDETDITVEGDITDGTVNNDDRVMHHVITLEEQKVWLLDYIFDGTNGIQYLLFGGKYSDPDGDGTDEGTDVVISQHQIPHDVSNLFSPQVNIELKVGKAV